MVVISLAGSRRRPIISAKLQPWQGSTTIVDAIHGHSLSRAALQEAGLAQPGSGMKMGQFGCYLSHLQVWVDFLASGAARILILEDDANINLSDPRWASYEHQAQSVPWDILHVGTTIAQTTRRTRVSATTPNLMNVGGKFYTLLGYVLTRRGAQILVDSLKGKVMAVPVDTQICTLETRGALRGYGFTPTLFTTFDNFSTTESIM